MWGDDRFDKSLSIKKYLLVKYRIIHSLDKSVRHTFSTQTSYGKSSRGKATQADGFSLVEVLVSILMIAGFLATAMQALVAATAIKVKSEEISEATSWMQEDLEAVKFEAYRLGLVSPSNYDPDHNTLDANDCQTGGFADDLQTVLTSNTAPYNQNSQEKYSAIGNREYRLERSLTPKFHTLSIQYSVLNPRNGKQIGELYAEVIPEVALYC